MNTGDRIKSLRIKKGMSQEELGAKIGVKKAAINKYETGLVVNLKRSTLSKLADALETTPVYLMGFKEETPPNHTVEGSEEDIKLFRAIQSLPPDRKEALLHLLGIE